MGRPEKMRIRESMRSVIWTGTTSSSSSAGDDVLGVLGCALYAVGALGALTSAAFCTRYRNITACPRKR